MGLKKRRRLGKRHFSRNSEWTLGTFSVRFCGMFVLPCLAVLVPGGALATLLLAAAAATAVLVPGGAFGQQQQQQQQVSWWEIEKAEKVGKKTFFLDACFLVCKLAMLYKSEQRLLKVYTYKHTYTTRHTHMGNVNRAVSSFPIFPGSAAGAAALKFGSAGSPRVACPTSVPERLEL